MLLTIYVYQPLRCYGTYNLNDHACNEQFHSNGTTNKQPHDYSKRQQLCSIQSE